MKCVILSRMSYVVSIKFAPAPENENKQTNKQKNIGKGQTSAYTMPYAL